MTYLKYLFLFSVLISSSCRDNHLTDSQNYILDIQEQKEENPESTSTTEDLKLIEHRPKRISEFPPLTQKQFLTWKPDTLLGLPNTDTNTDPHQDLGSFNTHYIKNNEEIKLQITHVNNNSQKEVNLLVSSLSRDSLDN